VMVGMIWNMRSRLCPMFCGLWGLGFGRFYQTYIFFLAADYAELTLIYTIFIDFSA
jgi:hypothetical protein